MQKKWREKKTPEGREAGCERGKKKKSERKKGPGSCVSGKQGKGGLGKKARKSIKKVTANTKSCHDRAAGAPEKKET